MESDGDEAALPYAGFDESEPQSPPNVDLYGFGDVLLARFDLYELNRFSPVLSGLCNDVPAYDDDGNKRFTWAPSGSSNNDLMLLLSPLSDLWGDVGLDRLEALLPVARTFVLEGAARRILAALVGIVDEGNAVRIFKLVHAQRGVDLMPSVTISHVMAEVHSLVTSSPASAAAVLAAATNDVSDNGTLAALFVVCNEVASAKVRRSVAGVGKRMADAHLRAFATMSETDDPDDREAMGTYAVHGAEMVVAVVGDLCRALSPRAPYELRARHLTLYEAMTSVRSMLDD